MAVDYVQGDWEFFLFYILFDLVVQWYVHPDASVFHLKYHTPEWVYVATVEVIKVLGNFGLEEELKRCGNKKVRSGKGKVRGRRYRTKRGPLVVIGKDEGVKRALENIPGIDVYLVKELDVSSLAPGTHPGRFTIFTKSAIKELDSDGREKGK